MLRQELIDVVEDNFKGNKLSQEFENKIAELLRIHTDLSASGKQREALKAIREAVALKPDDLELRLKLAHTLVQTGCGTGDTSCFTEAESEYLKIVESDPNNYHGLGYAYMFMNEYDKAIGAFNRIPDGNQYKANALAQAYTQKGDFEEAIKLTQSIAINSLNSMTSGLRDLALSYKNIGNLDAALTIYKTLIKVLESFKTEPQFLNNLWTTYLDLASLYLNMVDTDEAIDAMSEALEIAKLATERRSNIIFNALSFSKPIRTGEGTDLDWFIKDIKSGRFNSLANNPEYESLIEKASKMASEDNRID
jgi:Flp pilus assembly protein TadD